MDVLACESNSQVPWVISGLRLNFDLLTCDTFLDPWEVTQVLIFRLDMNDPAESVLGLLSPTSADPPSMP
jgi:hypothetical protein